MKLFEEIYRNAMLLRLQEARALNTVEEIYKALKKDASGRRYIETLLNGKKNLPEWFRTLADYDNLDLIKQPLEALLNRFKAEPKSIINDAICLLFRKSDSIDTLKEILKNSMDTLVQYAKNAKTQWISKLNKYNDVMIQDYNPELWHDFEKEIQDFKVRKNATRGKELSNEDKNNLYDTLYEDANWGLYVPKSFEGDSELASHIKEFQNGSKTYNKTQWCTAADSYYFDHYSDNGTKPLYVIKYFENGVYIEAWQIAFMDEHIELMDKRDERKFDFLFKNAPMELFNKIIDTSNETESYIFPSLVKRYNNSTDGFNLDIGYSIFSRLPNLSDDVKSLIGKEISIEDLIKTSGFISSDSLEILIKGLVNLKNKGYSLKIISKATNVLGIKNIVYLEKYLDLIKGNITLDELKEFSESIGQYYWSYIELEALIRLKGKGYSLKYLSEVNIALGYMNLYDLEYCINLIKGNITLDELKEFMKSIGKYHFMIGEVEVLTRLVRKGYSLKYLSDAILALGSGSVGIKDLEKCLELIKGNFTLEDLNEFRESLGWGLRDYDLESLIRLKRKGYSLKDLSKILGDFGLASVEGLESLLKG